MEHVRVYCWSDLLAVQDCTGLQFICYGPCELCQFASEHTLKVYQSDNFEKATVLQKLLTEPD